MDSTVTPVWMREPLKAIAWVASAVLAIVGVLLELALAVTDIVPDEPVIEGKSPKTWVALAIAAGTAVSIAATRVLAVVGRERVYSPATVAAAGGQPPMDQGDLPAPVAELPIADDTTELTPPPEE